MFDLILSLFLIYLFLAAAGFGLFWLLTPAYLARPLFVPFLLPLLGSAQLVLLCTYVILFRLPVASALPVSLALSAVLAFCAFFLRPHFLGDLATGWREAFRGTVPKLLFVAALLILLAAVSPGLREGTVTVPFRVGHDQVQNVQVAQFFLEGGTLETARQSDALKKQTLIVDEGVRAMRWGMSAALATYTLATRSIHPYKVAVPGMILSYLLLFGLTFFLLTEVLGVPPGSSLFAALAVPLNSNMLNLLYEGYWAQAFVMPVYALALLLILDIRGGAKAGEKAGQWRSVGLLAFLVASLGTTFSEGIPVLCIFITIMFVLDLLMRRRPWSGNVSILAALAAAAVLLSPALPMLGQHWAKVCSYYLRVGGFWQPLWALPSEILGLSNIYEGFMRWFGPDFSPKLMSRTPSELVTNGLVSIAVVAAFAAAMARHRKADRAFWLAAPCFVFAIWLGAALRDQTNYTYMKSYTMLLPFLFAGTYYGLYTTGISGARWSGLLSAGLRSAMVAVIVLVGLFHIQEYRQTSVYPDNAMFDLYGLSKKNSMESYVFVPREKMRLDHHPDERAREWMSETMLLPLFPVFMVDEWRLKDQNYAAHSGRPVLLFLRKSDLACYPCTLQKNIGKIFYENSSFLIIRTGRTLGEALTPGQRPDFAVFWNLI